MPKRIEVIQESKTGRNEKFKDNLTNKVMTRPQFVKEIKNGNYENYTVKKINNLETPVSKPDKKRNNNLG
ncbi:hypothetical protein [Listeria booriae]|uniref:hypothetical protein n=1 Tax=Listeria booriae TaxID=1552123 RepID=UPI00163DDB02|nr:hypothetical protein [Listeria booriae]